MHTRNGTSDTKVRMRFGNATVIPPREITPESIYKQRRRLMQGGAMSAVAMGLTGVAGWLARTRAAYAGASVNDGQAWATLPGVKLGGPYGTSEIRTPLKDVTSYNNFYEFGTDKSEPADNAGSLHTRPWTISFEGEIAKPRTIDIDSLIKLYPLEERIYRLRCVEGWSMVIPWVGFPLGPLLKSLQPTSRAKYVAFTTKLAPAEMPGQRRPVLAWPYVEGLRMDEALHPLTLFAVGLYGRVLPNQNGAPVRLVVPWKYGYKSIKSVVTVRLVSEQPPTSWNLSAPQEYGFYSNVNPDVDHPRWSQKRERRIGEFLRRPTQPFNGYGDQVASLYAGMDLRVNH